MSAEAVVGSDGVTGLTVKHSVEAESLASGIPCVPDVKSARQQYLPIAVIVAAAERTGCVVALVTVCVSTVVPPVVQVSVAFAIGPQRLKTSEPVQIPAPPV